MGRSEDAPIVSEWGATKRRSEALQDNTCETMIVAELQRLVFSLSMFSRHAAPHHFTQESRVIGRPSQTTVASQSAAAASSMIAAETFGEGRLRKRTKGSDPPQDSASHRSTAVRSAETPRWPLFRASHFPPSYPARSGPVPLLCLGVKVVLVVPRQKFQVDCVYPRPRPRSRPGRAVFVDGSLGLGLLMAMSNCGRVVVALRPRKQRRGKGDEPF